MEERYYRVIRSGESSDYIEHGLFGREKKNHKYLLREWANGKWKYYYTQAQIAARKLGSKVTKKDNSKEIKQLQKTANDARKQSTKAGSDLKKSIINSVSNGKKKVGKLLQNIGKTSTKALKNAQKQIKSGQKAVQKFLSDPPGYYTSYTQKNGVLGMHGGASNEAFATAHRKAAVTDVANGFRNAGEAIVKGFKNAGNDITKSREYANDTAYAHDPLNRAVNNLILDNKGHNPANYDWEKLTSGWYSSRSEAEKDARKKYKSKK